MKENDPVAAYFDKLPETHSGSSKNALAREALLVLGQLR